MRVWRLVIKGTQEQLSNTSINKEKSEELSDHQQEQEDKKQDIPTTIQDGEIKDQTNQNQDNQDSMQSDNNASQTPNNQSNNEIEQSQDQSSKAKQQSSSSSQSQSSQLNSDTQQSSDKTQSKNNPNQEINDDKSDSVPEQSQNQSSDTESQQPQQSSSVQPNSDIEQSQDQNLKEKDNQSYDSDNIEENENQLDDNQDKKSNQQNESPKQKKRRKRKEQLKKNGSSNDNSDEETQDESKPKDKGRWKKNKPNRQNPKNDFQGIYRKQKKKIKEQQEKTKAARKEQQNQMQKKKKSKEAKPEISKQSQDILDELQQIQPFTEREHDDKLGKLGIEHDELPASLIRMLIQKFVNQRFKGKKSELNVRGTSIEKKKGFHKWDVPQIAKHLKSKQYTEIMSDKYSYEYSNGANETIPLSFYFDVSGSMNKYNPLLVVIIRELLKSNVKVIVGANEYLYYQIDSLKSTTKDEELLNLLKYLQFGGNVTQSKYPWLKYKNLNGRYLYEFLKEKKAEKCVIFSDFDPIKDVIALSKVAQVYWFSFENIYGSLYAPDYDSLRDNLPGFNGFYYKVQNVDDIVYGLEKINSNRFEALCYIDDQKQNIKRRN